MEEERTSLPVRPVTREEEYLHAIVAELRKLNALLGAAQDSGDLLLDDEVRLREDANDHIPETDSW